MFFTVYAFFKVRMSGVEVGSLRFPWFGVCKFEVPWFGVLRFGVSWFGVPRFGVPRFGVPWFGVPSGTPKFWKNARAQKMVRGKNN